MSGGYKSLLAHWIGRAAGYAGGKAGIFSMLAPWLGGAGSPAPTGDAKGYKSFLGFWIGGAAAPRVEAGTERFTVITW